MRNDFKATADTLNLGFVYGRKDFLNLMEDAETDKTYLYAEPPRTTPIRSGTGVTTGETVVGKFMLLKKGNMDAKYDEEQNAEGVTVEAKYQDIIEPMKTTLESVINNLEDICNDGGYEITYNYIEIINVLDITMDGLLINYTAIKNN